MSNILDKRHDLLLEGKTREIGPTPLNGGETTPMATLFSDQLPTKETVPSPLLLTILVDRGENCWSKTEWFTSTFSAH